MDQIARVGTDMRPVCADVLYKAGMRQLPSGVCIVSTSHLGARRGLTLTALCSVSADPPTLLVCVNRSASAHDLIEHSGCFAVNQLAIEHNDEAQIFAGRRGIDDELRFKRGSWSILETGAPILEGAVANFDCRVTQTIQIATHSIFVGEVAAARFDESREPLVFLRGAYARAALSSVQQ